MQNRAHITARKLHGNVAIATVEFTVAVNVNGMDVWIESSGLTPVFDVSERQSVVSDLIFSLSDKGFDVSHEFTGRW